MKYLFILLIILFACQKEGQENVASYQGDYHLTYIYVNDLEYLTPADVSDQVGIRVLDNGNIETYINGDLHRKYKLKKARILSNDTVRAVYMWENNESIAVKLFEGNKLQFPVFPYEDEQNFFYKK